MKMRAFILLLVIMLFGSVTASAEVTERTLTTLEGTYQISVTVSNPDNANAQLKQSYGVNDTLPTDIIDNTFNVDIKGKDGEYKLFHKGEELQNPGLSADKNVFVMSFDFMVTTSSMKNIAYGIEAYIRYDENTDSFDLIEPKGFTLKYVHQKNGETWYGSIGNGTFEMIKSGDKADDTPDASEEEQTEEGAQQEEQIPRGITFVKGIVEVKRAGTDEWIRVRGNMPLNAGDTVRTGKNSYAEVGCSISEFAAAAGSEIRLSSLSVMTVPDTTLTVEKKSRVRVAVDDAIKNVYSLFGKEEFEVETPSACAGIRGTDFIVEVDEEGNTTFLLNEGSILVTSKYDNSEILLSPGEKVVSSIGQTLADPEPLTTKEKNEFTTEYEENLLEENSGSGFLIVLILILICVIGTVILFIKKKSGKAHSNTR